MHFQKPLRAMWLLNHGSARKFEIPTLKKLGISEIFLPKIVPRAFLYRSSSIDFSEDAHLTIPAEDLALLNSVDWYEHPTREAMEIANKYFDIVFFISSMPLIKNLAYYFKGTMILRAYGMPKNMCYSKYLKLSTNGEAIYWLKSMGSRFWFGQVFNNLKNVESDFIKSRSIDLPLSLSEPSVSSVWTGTNKSIFFVCPDIQLNDFYKAVHEQFIKKFAGFPYIIGGVQTILHYKKSHILGFVSRQQHEQNMRDMRLMFYHSSEPRHLHYHPLEAIQAGMPLIFMGGGVLDKMGGRSLPGRCSSVAEARSKIKRILNDDWDLINKIRQSQTIILDYFNWEKCQEVWLNSFSKIFAERAKLERPQPLSCFASLKKIAIILPEINRGGHLQAAKYLGQAIHQGSRQWNESVEVILVYPDSEEYTKDDFIDLLPNIQQRNFQWKILRQNEARRIMRFANYSEWNSLDAKYLIPDDGLKYLTDCDLWIIVSDNLSYPLLPLRPIIHIIYDYVQRYIPGAKITSNPEIIRRAERILVTSQFTLQDVSQYAGISQDKIRKVPMLAKFYQKKMHTPSKKFAYFIWTTSAGVHKNHENALKALQWYYEGLNGLLFCKVTGMETLNLLYEPSMQLAELIKKFRENELLKKMVLWQGFLPQSDYQTALAGASFLWHTTAIDNGTTAVIEAASLGVPALSTHYPAMGEINEQFELDLLFMDSTDFKDMAAKLKEMEETYQSRQQSVPPTKNWEKFDINHLAGKYWEAIRECL